MTTVYIVRHCEADGNLRRIFQGHTDAEISEKGAEQLRYLAERFRSVPLDAVYSSPLKRALLTADSINRYHGLPVETDAGLTEISGGCIEGLPWAELPVQYPEYARCWNLEPDRFEPKDGESMRQVYDRIWKTVTRIAAAHPDETIAVASHGCAIRNLLCRAKGLPIKQLNTVEWCDNTGVSILEFDESGRCRVALENDISHLPPELSTFATQTWWKKENVRKLYFD